MTRVRVFVAVCIVVVFAAMVSAFTAGIWSGDERWVQQGLVCALVFVALLAVASGVS